MLSRVDYVVQQEGVKATPDGVQSLITLSQGDMRRALNILSTVDENSVYACTGQPLPSDIASIVHWMLNDSFSTAYQNIMKLKTLKGLALQDILTQVHLYIQRVEFPSNIRITLLEKMADVEFGARSAKVIIIGQPGVGKTSMVLRYCRNMFERNYKTTIGVDFEVEKYNVLGVPFNVQLWDTAGAERFRGVTTAYFRGAQVVMLVFDLGSEESLVKTRDWLKDAQEFCQNQFEVFLVGTKYDSLLEHDYLKIEEVAKQFAAEYKAEYWYTSSKSGEHIEELFTRVTVLAFENIVTRELESVQASEPKVQVAASSTLIRVRAKEPASPKRKRKCCPR
eukprot:Em0015g140a